MAEKTPKKKRAEKVYAFIDSQNLNLGVRSQGWKLDFKRFFVYLKAKYKVSKCYLFIGHVPGNEKLYAKLKEYGYLIVFKPTVLVKEKPIFRVKGNVDAELVLHAMIEFPNYSKAVIVSGDGDFHCLVEYLKSNNKLLKIVIPNIKGYSSLYKKYSGYLLFMNSLREKLGDKEWDEENYWRPSLKHG